MNFTKIPTYSACVGEANHVGNVIDSPTIWTH